MPASRIREIARAEDSTGTERAVPGEAVEAMVRFEEQYGGLCYPLLGGNDMEYGLFGEATVTWTDRGWVFPGILDGDFTEGVDVLLDGRTMVTLGGTARVINRSVRQRLESDALLSSLRRWPHTTLQVTTEPGQPPAVDVQALPGQIEAATGPADSWWFDGETAVHLNLHVWWTERDRWLVNCFAKSPDLVSAVVENLPGVPADTAAVNWCMLCGHAVELGQVCLPGASLEPEA